MGRMNYNEGGIGPAYPPRSPLDTVRLCDAQAMKIGEEEVIRCGINLVMGYRLTAH